MNIRDLEKVFKEAKDHNADVCIELTVPGRKANKFIIILNDNLDYELDYYKVNHNDRLEYNTDSRVKIINAFVFVFGMNKYNL
jgi:hypothetical protein